jgi:basic membrane protein A and related proteins
VFSGPIADQSGAEKVAKGAKLDDGALSGMDWFVKGVEGA